MSVNLILCVSIEIENLISMSVGIRKHVKNSGNKIKAMQNSSSDDSHTSNNHDDMFRSCCRTQISVISCHVFRDIFPSCLPYNHHLLTQLTALWWHQQKLLFIICRAECSNWGIKVLDVHNNRNFQTWLLIKIQLTIFIAVGSFKQRKSCFEEKWHRVKIKFSTLQSFWGAGFSQFYFSSSQLAWHQRQNIFCFFSVKCMHEKWHIWLLLLLFYRVWMKCVMNFVNYRESE